MVTNGIAPARFWGGSLWARGAGFGWCWDAARCTSAVACSAMKVVVAASMMAGERRAGRCCCQAFDGRGLRS